MLDHFDFKEETSLFTDKKTSKMGESLDKLQRKLQALEIPALILIEGWESSGKGHVLKDLTREMDPRYVRVEVFEEENDQENQYPSAWRFWQKIPGNQEVVFFDRSFYNQVMNYEEKSDKLLQRKIKELMQFERTLLDDNMIIVKLFLNISEKTQKKRIEALEEDKYRRFLVTDLDKHQNKHYDKHQEWFDRMLEATNFDDSPWHIINAEDKKEASKEALGVTIQAIKEGIKKVKAARKETKAPHRTYQPFGSDLHHLDLSATLSKKAYDKAKDKLQPRAAELVYECYTLGIPIVLAFEGVDAAGKGGAIKRLTREIDPRSYKTYGIKAPSPVEKAHHYLWRFKTKFPKDGLMAIFDRSWYGRVLVERIEGFATEKEWERAYHEITQMEATLTNHGTLVLKFFLFIDKDEEAKRFKDREEDPDKQYKITEEDWRNRDKWDKYMVAYQEMLDRTDKPNAPWITVATNDKYAARIQVLETFVKAVENHIDQWKKNHKENDSE